MRRLARLAGEGRAAGHGHEGAPEHVGARRPELVEGRDAHQSLPPVQPRQEGVAVPVHVVGRSRQRRCEDLEIPCGGEGSGVPRKFGTELGGHVVDKQVAVDAKPGTQSAGRHPRGVHRVGSVRVEPGVGGDERPRLAAQVGHHGHARGGVAPDWRGRRGDEVRIDGHRTCRRVVPGRRGHDGALVRRV